IPTCGNRRESDARNQVDYVHRDVPAWLGRSQPVDIVPDRRHVLGNGPYLALIVEARPLVEEGRVHVALGDEATTPVGVFDCPDKDRSLVADRPRQPLVGRLDCESVAIAYVEPPHRYRLSWRCSAAVDEGP